MANSIEFVKEYSPMIDEVYTQASTTSILDENNSKFIPGLTGDSVYVPKMSMQGLGSFNRGTGEYTDGDMSYGYELMTYNYMRSRGFNISQLDKLESNIGDLYSDFASKFMRNQVAPETDAFRFATLASKVGINKATPATLTQDTVIAALRAAQNSLDASDVPYEDRILFIRKELLNMIVDLDTTKSKEIVTEFASIQTVSPKRFYTAINLLDGKTSGEEAGGYIKDATNGKDINFIVVDRSAIIAHKEVENERVFTPQEYQKAIAWHFDYMIRSIFDVRENGVKGIYLHNQA